MEQRMINITEDELRKIVSETVKETLTTIGIQHEDPVEMQRDFTHLRNWRKAVDTARSTSMLTAIGILITGLMGALWLGFQTMLSKGGTP